MLLLTLLAMLCASSAWAVPPDWPDFEYITIADPADAKFKPGSGVITGDAGDRFFVWEKIDQSKEGVTAPWTQLRYRGHIGGSFTSVFNVSDHITAPKYYIPSAATRAGALIVNILTRSDPDPSLGCDDDTADTGVTWDKVVHEEVKVDRDDGTTDYLFVDQDNGCLDHGMGYILYANDMFFYTGTVTTTDHAEEVDANERDVGVGETWATSNENISGNRSNDQAHGTLIIREDGDRRIAYEDPAHADYNSVIRVQLHDWNGSAYVKPTENLAALRADTADTPGVETTWPFMTSSPLADEDTELDCSTVECVTLHVIWRETNPSNTSLFDAWYSKCEDDGSDRCGDLDDADPGDTKLGLNWTTPLKVSATGEKIRQPQLAISSDGQVIALYEQYDGDDRIKLARLCPGATSFETPIFADNIAINLDQSLGQGARRQLYIDLPSGFTDERLTVVYSEMEAVGTGGGHDEWRHRGASTLLNGCP